MPLGDFISFRVLSSLALVCAVVTRSPFWRSHVPVCGTESIPSCAIPAIPAILAERPPA
ncbi:hypothetical protein D3C80_1984950 [compost metagenome]